VQVDFIQWQVAITDLVGLSLSSIAVVRRHDNETVSARLGVAATSNQTASVDEPDV